MMRLIMALIALTCLAAFTLPATAAPPRRKNTVKAKHLNQTPALREEARADHLNVVRDNFVRDNTVRIAVGVTPALLAPDATRIGTPDVNANIDPTPPDDNTAANYYMDTANGGGTAKHLRVLMRC